MPILPTPPPSKKTFVQLKPPKKKFASPESVDTKPIEAITTSYHLTTEGFANMKLHKVVMISNDKGSIITSDVSYWSMIKCIFYLFCLVVGAALSAMYYIVLIMIPGIVSFAIVYLGIRMVYGSN